MKTILFAGIALAASAFTGCRSVAVVTDDHHRHGVHGGGDVRVYYEGDRPYYYSGRTRTWGYPAGYRSRDVYVAPRTHSRTVIRY